MMELRKWSSSPHRFQVASTIQLVLLLVRAGRANDARQEFDAGLAPLFTSKDEEIRIGENILSVTIRNWRQTIIHMALVGEI